MAKPSSKKDRKSPKPNPQPHTQPQQPITFKFSPRSPKQAEYMQTIANNDLTFAIGPAGTGKTFLAVAAGIEQYLAHKVERIVLVRPAVEAGERLGFLPGTLQEKVDPYLAPIYDALSELLPADRVKSMLEDKKIEVAPLAFMRGRTLKKAFIIVDEAQNTTVAQIKMCLTRMGQHSKMVVNGDQTQIDLPGHVKSGLNEALRILDPVKGIGLCEFTSEDVVRHRLVQRIVEAWDADTKAQVEN